MRLIIAGGRHLSDFKIVEDAVNLFVMDNIKGSEEIEVVSGACDDAKGAHTHTRSDGKKVYGADGLGERLAYKNGWAVKIFPADWGKYGPTAGPIRNSEMAKYATHAICFWDKKSKGTGDMVRKSKNLVCKVIYCLPY